MLLFDRDWTGRGGTKRLGVNVCLSLLWLLQSTKDVEILFWFFFWKPVERNFNSSGVNLFAWRGFVSDEAFPDEIDIDEDAGDGDFSITSPVCWLLFIEFWKVDRFFSLWFCSVSKHAPDTSTNWNNFFSICCNWLRC